MYSGIVKKSNLLKVLLSFDTGLKKFFSMLGLGQTSN